MRNYPFSDLVKISASAVPADDSELNEAVEGHIEGMVGMVMFLLNGNRFQTLLTGKIRKIVGETPVVHKVGLKGYRVEPTYGTFQAMTPNRLAMGICTFLGLVVGIAVAWLWRSSTVMVQMGAEVREIAVQSVVDLWWFKAVIILFAIIAGRLAGTTFTKLREHRYVNGIRLEKVEPSDDETVPAMTAVRVTN